MKKCQRFLSLGFSAQVAEILPKPCDIVASKISRFAIDETSVYW